MESRWSDGQIELFHALGKICERVGQEQADKLLRGSPNGVAPNTLDGRSFVTELKELRERAGLVDDLEKTNKCLRAELDAAREQLLDVTSVKSTSETNSEVHETRVRRMKIGILSNRPDERDLDCNISHERLMQKHNILAQNYQELAIARNQLENKLRSSQKLNREWVEYANGLEKRIGRLEGKLASHGIALKRRSEETSFENVPPNMPSSSRELVPISTGEARLESSRQELPNILHMSERISELTRNAAVEASAYEPPYSQINNSSDPSKRQQEGLGIKDTPRPLFTDSARSDLGLGASDLKVSKLSPTLLTDATPSRYGDSGLPVSPESHDFVSAEDFEDVLPALPSRQQFDIPPPTIKEEPSSDTPVVMSSRSVKKRKVRHDTGANESTHYTKVKFEIVTSSPVGLAGFQSLFPRESMDLDEIGEKMDTPKKRRWAFLDPSNENNLITCETIPAKLLQNTDLRADERNTRFNGNPLALQPGSPNKQVMSHVALQKQDTKRCGRHEERISGAVILGEDDENDTIRKTDFSNEIQVDNARKLRANVTELQRRLSDLLEEPCPEKELLTPLRTPVFPASSAQLRAKATSNSRCEKPAPSSRFRIKAGTTPRTPAHSSEDPKSGHKPSTTKQRSARTQKDVRAGDASQEPLRARPVHRLGLEHFKVNPEFNQGSNYAFTDVVRGRELRKCLPGCTKAECCGDKFRKFIEFARAHENQTLSQQEEDERLLEDYMGDNKSRLRNMTKREREEVLIRARTRDLANKASKHRHAYERRRTPPGFWRSDFPSTQELHIDREEAASRERDLVQQRYQEAMRPGGRWLFRDE